MSFQRVCPAAEIALGAAVSKDIDGTPVLIAHTNDGDFHAVIDNCSHEEFPLSDGAVVGCTIECSRHGSEFDLRTGAALNLPATESIAVFPVEIRDGDVYVGLSAINKVQSSNGVQR